MEIVGLLLILALCFITWFPPETYTGYFRKTTASEGSYNFTIWSMRVGTIVLLALYVLQVFAA